MRTSTRAAPTDPTAWRRVSLLIGMFSLIPKSMEIECYTRLEPKKQIPGQRITCSCPQPGPTRLARLTPDE